MQQGHNNNKETVVILMAWLVALSLAYFVFLKFKLLFH